VGLPEISGKTEGHEVISVAAASEHLETRGHHDAVAYLQGLSKHASPNRSYPGSSEERGSNRKTFGVAVSDLLDELAPEERRARVRVIDTDLEGSTGLKTIHQRHPEVFLSSGIMERGNLSAAAGFGFEEGKVGVFSTFSAFLEMVVSEVTMARLNHTNLLCHFSHAGVDDIADNTCHFGINLFFADNGLEEQEATPLYFPADALQLTEVVKRTFWDRGIRFLFSVRSELPYILDDAGERRHDPANGYRFEPGRDEVVREGSAGWVVSYGESLHRALAAVELARERGIDVGLINKPHLNAVDEEALAKVGAGGFVLVVEGQSQTTGLGVRYGSWLLERGHTPRYRHLGVTQLGGGGTWAQMFHQGLESDAILTTIEALAL
jgi:transketolase C-terminal domain/subunit